MNEFHPYLALLKADHQFDQLCREQVRGNRTTTDAATLAACSEYWRLFSEAAWRGYLIEQDSITK
jgi:hypothetical protein